MPMHHWKDPQNCRRFFDEFAAEKGFDSLNPEEWYNLDLYEMLRKKVSTLSSSSFILFNIEG